MRPLVSLFQLRFGLTSEASWLEPRIRRMVKRVRRCQDDYGVAAFEAPTVIGRPLHGSLVAAFFERKSETKHLLLSKDHLNPIIRGEFERNEKATEDINYLLPLRPFFRCLSGDRSSSTIQTIGS